MGIVVVASSREHFRSIISEAGEHLRLKIQPLIQDYLVSLMEYHAETRNLFPGKESTLAESWLRAQQAEWIQEKRERLKLLGDRALYISGYFSDSLQNKVVDIDYYIKMGELAFGELAELTKTEPTHYLYRSLSRRFPDWVEVLSYVAQQTQVQSHSGVLRLYERYLKTGSDLAFQALLEQGVVSIPREDLKKSCQDE